jgi:hypothetical protein
LNISARSEAGAEEIEQIAVGRIMLCPTT